MTYDLMKQESPSPMCMLRWERVWMQHMHINLCRLIWVSSLQSFIIFIFWLRYSSHVQWDKINISATHIELLKDFYDIICFSFFVFLGLLLLRVIRHEAISVLPATTALLAPGNLSPAPQALFPPPKDGRGTRSAPPAPPEPFVTGLH